MKIGFVFWLLMILWLVLGLYLSWPQGGATFALVGGNLLLFVLLFLLGWKAFGLPIQN